MRYLFLQQDKICDFKSFFTTTTKIKPSPIKNNNTKLLIGWNIEIQVVKVLHATNPINSFSTKLHGTFITFEIKNPNVVNRNRATIVDNKSAIIR